MSEHLLIYVAFTGGQSRRTNPSVGTSDGTTCISTWVYVRTRTQPAWGMLPRIGVYAQHSEGKEEGEEEEGEEEEEEEEGEEEEGEEQEQEQEQCTDE